ncbi:hypothetical protein GWC95_03980 [Sediminibacterium roseum]|uniref:UDP-2,4-diacetamido-2,4,6-trideoxy-beta-L-altropyranose hydrolase n=1 Tax=Sediminibacterium roseum TaxID=1978412 RepID=A0ABW9ZPP2_9BACT|nr:hypothetical protein [Sediminibacterium roseum]
MGHIMRCVSLSEMLGPAFSYLFIVNNADEKVKELVSQHGEAVFINVEDIESEPEAISGIIRQDDIFVSDGYFFDTAYQEQIKKKVHKLVMIDDKAMHFFYADVIINHGGLSEIPSYRTAPFTRVLSGFDYLIARNEFIHAASSPELRKISPVETVFICMGGADPFDITTKIINVCLSFDYIQRLNVVTGAAYAHRSSLSNVLAADSSSRIRHYENLNAKEMVQHIAESQVSFATASSTAMEICCVRSGLVSGIVVDNQNAIHQQLLANGCCISAGNFITASEAHIADCIRQIVDPGVLGKVIANQKRNVDGRSAERLLEVFTNLAA